ncbi:beta family protein [Streptomyces sp. NPDC055299]
MPEPLYVPVLATRPHAAHAYRELRPAVQAAVAPLWTLPPRPGLQPDVLAAALRRDLAVVSRVQRHRPAWLDAPFADGTETTALCEVLPQYWSLTPLRPVTGPGRPPAQQAAALASAASCGGGLGIRVRMTGEWLDGAVEDVRALRDRADPAVCLDLLLDLAAVRADRPDAGKETLRALDALIPLAPWRCVAVMAGGFPELTAALVEQDLAEEPRTDWGLWHEIGASGRAYLPLLRYGDYGILAPRALERTPSEGRGGPSWGVLRYTTQRSFLLCKVLTRGEDRAAVTRAAAGRLLGLDDFRGAGASAGEGWLRSCAQGAGPVGTGNHTVWNRVGNVQHMTYVVESLRI